MAIVDSASTSVILRATHIFLVRVASAEVGAWRPQGPRTQQRTVTLTLQLEQTLKGEVLEAAGATVQITVEQTGIVGSRIFAVPGVWSNKPVDAGTRYVVFCRSSSGSAAEVLGEPTTERVLPAEEALHEVQWALESEHAGDALPDVLSRVRNRRASLGPLFAEYLAARLDEIMFARPEAFDQFLSFLETPGLSARFRGLVLEAVYSRLLLFDPAPPGFADRLVVGTMRLMALPEAAVLHDNLLQTYLPNLVGLEGGATGKSAAEIFGAFPGEREQAEQVLMAYPNPPAAARILDWLRR